MPRSSIQRLATLCTSSHTSWSSGSCHLIALKRYVYAMHVNQAQATAGIETLPANDACAGLTLNAPLPSRTTIDSLPNELLGMIFEYLERSDLARAARVRRRWNSISADARAWRDIYFTPGRSDHPYKCKTTQRIDIVIAKAKDKAVSVDFDNLDSKQVFVLLDWLLRSAPTLKQIQWSPRFSGDRILGMDPFHRFAASCPQLEYLEVHWPGGYMLSWLPSQSLGDTLRLLWR